MCYLFGSVLLEFNVLITSLVANRLSDFVKIFLLNNNQPGVMRTPELDSISSSLEEQNYV